MATTYTRTLRATKEQSTQDYWDTSADPDPAYVAKGNGSDRHLPIGRTAGNDIYRGFVKFGLDWSDVYQVVSAFLVLRSTSAIHVSFGAGPTIEVERLVEAIVSAGGSEGSWTAGIGDEDGKHPGPNATSTGLAVGGPFNTQQEATKRIDITTIVEAWAPVGTALSSGTVKTADPASNYGLRLKAQNESTEADRWEVYGMRAGDPVSRPYIELTFITNRPPNAPIVTAPEQGDPPIVQSTNADTLTVSFLFSDLDAADTCQRVELEVYGDGATDPAPGTLLATTGGVAPTPLGPLNAYSVTITGLTPRTNQRFRLRTQDSASTPPPSDVNLPFGAPASDGAWGPFTSLADGRAFTAYRVLAPTQSQMQTTPDAPHFFGSLNSQDPEDFLTGAEVEAYRDDVGGSVALMAGMVDIGGTSTRSDITYSGPTLNDGTVVRWRQRHRNQDQVVGEWTPFMTTTIHAEVGPTAMSPIDTSTKLLTRTPQLTIGDAVAFTEYQWRLYRSSVLIFDSGLLTQVAAVSVNVTPAAGLLDWGDGADLRPLEWEAAVGNGTLGPFSPRRPIRIDSLPPTTLSITGRTSGGAVETADPVYVSPYTDPDRGAFAEWPQRKEFEIRAAATPAGTGALQKHVTRRTAITESEQLGATFVPVADAPYDVRVRYRDDATAKASTTLAAGSSAGATNVKVTSVASLAIGDELTLEPGTADEETRRITGVGTAGSGGTGVTVDHGYTLAHSNADIATVYYWGPWTSWLTFTYTEPPVVTANLPADAEVVTDPTRALSWTFTSVRPQALAVISIFERLGGVDELIWQAVQDGAAISWDLPPYLLDTGATYAWEVQAYDSLGLSGTTARRTFTTSFSAPAEVTDLATAADTEASAIIVTWTASADPYLHHYRVYWRTVESTWLRIDDGPAALGDGRTPLTEPTFTHYGARLGANDYRVEAHNGAQPSDPAYVAGTLAAARPGAWMLVERNGEVALPLDPTSAPRVVNTQVETYRPPGRGSALVLSWGASGRSVDLACSYMPAEDGNLTVIAERLYANGDRAWLKAPAGYATDPLLVVPTSISDDPMAGAFVGLRLGLEEVEA